MDTVCYCKTFSRSYGRTNINKLKHMSVKYTDEERLPRYMRDPLYHRAQELGSCYEVSMAKKKIKWDLPNIVAFFVYQYAKLNILEYVLLLVLGFFFHFSIFLF